jgi:hypothetical protein
MTARTPWTDAENSALVALYFAMLDAATSGEKYNKAAMIRIAQNQPKSSDPDKRGENAAAVFASWDYAGKLADRSRGSIEAKLMNATAAHRDIDPTAVTMDGYGYRALSNYQSKLKDAMLNALMRREFGPDPIYEKRTA